MRVSFLCVCPSFPFGFEGGMWDLVVLIPDDCLPISELRSTKEAKKQREKRKDRKPK